jgi:hypothetical protein
VSLKRRSIRPDPSDQCDIITSILETAAYSDHALIITKVVGNSKNDMLHRGGVERSKLLFSFE